GSAAEAGGRPLPVLAEGVERAGGQRRRAEGGGVPLAAVERRVGGGETVPGQHRREDAVAGGVGGVERLRHRPEIFLESGGQRGRDAERVARRVGVEPQNAG